MQRRYFLLAATAALGLAFAGCGDDDEDVDATPTSTQAVSTPTRPAESPTNSPTRAATGSPAARTPTTGTPATGTPRPDGTIAPEGAGDTDRKTVKSNPDPIDGQAVVTDLRLGHHPEEGGWERIVFEFQGSRRPSAVIEYVTTAAQCGSGQNVQLPGTAMLSVTLNDAVAHTEAGQPTLDEREVGTPPGGSLIEKGVQTCDFEGQVQWVFGLEKQNRFKVSTLENPTRIVIDIKQ